MKLGEFKAVDPDRIEFCVVNRDGQRMRDPMVFSIPNDAGSARVEIHSINEKPWPTERPPGWGVGCWCQVEICRPQDTVVATVMVFDISQTHLRWLDTQTRETGVCEIHSVISFGPRAEVPG